MMKPGTATTGDYNPEEILRQDKMAFAARYAEESARQVLGAVLTKPSEWPKLQHLTPQHFHGYGDELADIFQAMRRAPSPGSATVMDWLSQHGKEGLHAVVVALALEGGPFGVDDGALQSVQDATLRRLHYHAVSELANMALNPDIDPFEATERMIERLQQHKAAAWGSKEGDAPPEQLLGDLAYNYWDAAAERKNSATTGLAELDKKIGGGLQPERLYVLLGGTGSGKTTLANQFAEHIASTGRPVYYITSEDTPSALLAKTVARLGQVDYNAVLYGYKSAETAITQALELVQQRPSATRLAYKHDTGGFSLEEMQARAGAHFERFRDVGPGVLVIDYLQRMARMQPARGGRSQDTRELVTLYTMQLRAVAESLNCTVLALSSQNRASYGGNGDRLASAKESGDIEYTADCVLVLEQVNPNKSDPPSAPGHATYSLYLAKNRLGPTGEAVELDWYAVRQTFAGMAR